MAHPPEKKSDLRAAYLGGLPLERAAEKVDVPLPTARRWWSDAKKAGDDWDKYRAAGLIVAGGGIEQALGRVISAGLVRCEVLLEQLEPGGNPEDAINPMDAVKAMGTLSDTISKLKAASKGMMPEADRLGVAMDVVKRLQAFIQSNYPQHGGAFAEVLMPFGEEIARAYG